MHQLAYGTTIWLMLAAWASSAHAQFGFWNTWQSPRDGGGYADGHVEATKTDTPSFSADRAHDEAVRRIDAALSKTVQWSIQERALGEVAEILEKELGIPIRLDHRALEDAGIATDTQITKRVQNISAGAGLTSILQDHGLAWIVENEQLVITTREEAETRLVTRVYPVADLVEYRDKRGPFQNYLPLMDVIQTAARPNSWRERGAGNGTIRPFAASGAIVVTQTADVHQSIEQLLATLRATRDAQGLKGPLPGRRPSKLPVPTPAYSSPVPVVGGVF